MLVLDEATSHLDSETEKAIQEMLENLRQLQDLTIVVIAHRLSTIKEADKICVLKDGAIIESGDHERLLKKNGLYSHLVKLQQLGAIRE